MSQADEIHTIPSLVGRLCQKHNLSFQVEAADVNNQFINNFWLDKNKNFFDELIDGLKKNFNENVDLKNGNSLNFVTNVSNEIFKTLIQIEADMTDPTTAVAAKTATDAAAATATKVLIVAGLLPLVAFVLYKYYHKESKAIDHDSQKNVEPIGSPANEPSYSQFFLLLIIEANRLNKELKVGASISEQDAGKVISNAMFGYCYREGDLQGEKVFADVECSEQEINFESEDRVFLQLALSAKPELAEGKPDKLAIREAMRPNERVKINALKKLTTMSSIKAFRSI